MLKTREMLECEKVCGVQENLTLQQNGEKQGKKQTLLILSVIKVLQVLFCFENYFPVKARNITHRITPALLTSAFLRNYVPLRIIAFVMRNLNSQNYTLWGYAHEMFWGINFGQNYTQQPQQLHKNIFGNLISNNFVTKSTLQRKMLADRGGGNGFDCRCHFVAPKF